MSIHNFMNVLEVEDIASGVNGVLSSLSERGGMLEDQNARVSMFCVHSMTLCFFKSYQLVIGIL